MIMPVLLILCVVLSFASLTQQAFREYLLNTGHIYVLALMST